MASALEALKAHLAQIDNLRMAAAVLNWDQRVYMPPRGTEARARQLATLAKLAHEFFVGDQTRDLLAAAEAAQAEVAGTGVGVAGGTRGGTAGEGGNSDEAALLRVARRDFTKATKVPTSLIVEMTEVCALAEDVWAKARRENDYPTFAPWLERILGLKRQYAKAIGCCVSIEMTPRCLNRSVTPW